MPQSSLNAEPKPATTGALNSIATGVQIAGRALFTLLVPLFAVPQEYGHYSYLSWFLNIVIAVSTLGLPFTAQRFVPSVENSDEQKRLEFFLHRICMWLFVATGCLFLVLHFTGALREITKFYLVTILLAGAAGAFTTVHYGILRGRRNFHQIIVAETVAQSVRFCALIVVIAALHRLTATSIILLESSYWISQCLYASTKYPSMPFRRANIDNRIEILKYVLSVAVTALLDTLVLQRIEVVFLTYWSTASNAGFFNLAAQIGVAITILPVAATTGLFSTFVQYNTGSSARATQLHSYSSTFSWLVMFPLVGISMLVMPEAIKAIYGMRYSAVAAVLPLILMARGLVIVNTASSIFLYAIGRKRQILLLSATTAASTIVLDTILIQRWNLTGAAAATLLVQVIVTITVVKLLGTSAGGSHGLKRATVVTGLATLIIEYALILAGRSIAASAVIVFFTTVAYGRDPEAFKMISGAVGHLRGLVFARSQT
jgi:O-antigen/teichoic acid export membrane protein